MKTLILNEEKIFSAVGDFLKLSFFALLFWLVASFFWKSFNPTTGIIDPGIFQVLALALFTWVALVVLALLGLGIIYQKLNPAASWNLVTQFDVLLPWQQFAFYWACYALLLCSAIGCLIAIC